MAELKEFEVIMRCTPVAGMNGKGEIVIQAEKVSELVRCKDCVWYDERRPFTNGHTLYECRNLERFFPADFFCKDGERREDVRKPD